MPRAAGRSCRQVTTRAAPRALVNIAGQQVIAGGSSPLTLRLHPNFVTMSPPSPCDVRQEDATAHVGLMVAPCPATWAAAVDGQRAEQ